MSDPSPPHNCVRPHRHRQGEPCIAMPCEKCGQPASYFTRGSHWLCPQHWLEWLKLGK